MRSTRTLPLLVGLVALVAAAAVALACNGSETKVSGGFDATGRFVLSGAWGKDGAPIANAKGMILESFTTADNVVISASNLAGKQVCFFGDLDAANRTMHVSGFKTCDAGACDAKGAMAQTAGGASCCPSQASAATAGAGSSCAAKTDAAVAGGAHCAGKTDAAVAGGAHCAGKADAASAGGSGCASKTDAAAVGGSSCASKANAAAAGGSSCGAKTDAAAAGGSCGSKEASAAKADKMVSAPANAIVYRVAGVTCGGCASKIESAVAKLAMKNVSGCKVDVENAQAIVTTTGDVDREAIQNAITAAGFPATPATEEAAKS